MTPCSLLLKAKPWIPQPRKHSVHYYGVYSTRQRLKRKNSNLSLHSDDPQDPPSSRPDTNKLSPQQRAALRKPTPCSVSAAVNIKSSPLSLNPRSFEKLSTTSTNETAPLRSLKLAALSLTSSTFPSTFLSMGARAVPSYQPRPHHPESSPS